MLWDIFCKVIDNHGDIGVGWRLSAELAARGDAVRLWVDDGAALAWMAPAGHERVEVVAWNDDTPPHEPGDVVVEAFGCDPPPAFVAALARKAARDGRQPPWINLEYLSAEPYVERNHGLPSPVLAGPGAGLVKQFFYPGFTEKTGGLLHERGLLQHQAAFDSTAWLAGHGIAPDAGERLVSLFCYEPPALPSLLRQLAQGPGRTRLLVTAGRARAAVESALPELSGSRLGIDFLPLMPQPEYDRLLWSCDLNFVRGEDSLVRALWAGRPFVWHIYPQDDGAHHAKLDAFLDWLRAPPGLRAFHHHWNGIPGTPPAALPDSLAGWAETAELARARALAGPELAAQLGRFVRRTR
ncbi:MAG: elongation factor P maturation arginine rhamnosyltransferase EarP [Pseudomonadota bacterium]